MKLRRACTMKIVFQSTLPTRGSDLTPITVTLSPSYFNPRSPRGGATGAGWAIPGAPATFQSTLPTRGSDMLRRWCMGGGYLISIHAPHEGERPRTEFIARAVADNFNPRSPRGGATGFLSLRPFLTINFNPRSPRGGATTKKTRRKDGRRNFNPRSPRGGAT